MAAEEPQLGGDVEFGDDMALVEGAAIGAMRVMRSNISMGGKGSCALPGPNSSPRPQRSNSSRE